MRGLFATSALVAVVFVAGCGGGGGGGGTTQTSGEATKPAKQVVKDAQQAAEAASSVHISGVGTESGKPIGLDLSLAEGKGATGSISIRGAKLDLIVVGKDAYLRAGPAFWKNVGGGGAAAAALFANKWLKFPTDNPKFGGFTGLTNPKAFFNKLKKHGKLENQGLTTYKGQSVVAIRDTTQGGTLYVAATGTPYPVAVIKSKGSSAGTITFDNWNESVTLTAPKGALDLSQFGG